MICKTSVAMVFSHSWLSWRLGDDY